MWKQLEEYGDPQRGEGYASVLVSGRYHCCCSCASAVDVTGVALCCATGCAWEQLQLQPLHCSCHRRWSFFLQPAPPAASHCLHLHLCPRLQVCQTDDEVAAALEAWARYGPQHPDPAAEYERLRPPPPKEPKLNTLDRFFKKPAQQQPSKQGQQQQEEPQAQDPPQQPQPQQKREHPQQKQEQAQQQAGAGSTAGAGAASSNALQALMAAARHPPKQAAAAAAAAAGPKGPTAAAAAGGGGSGAPRHSFPQATWARGLADIASNPERYVCGHLRVSSWAGNPFGHLSLQRCS